MAVVAKSIALPRPRRQLLPAGALQGAVWVLVVGLIVGPFIPMLYASARDRPLYEAGGVLTLDAYRQLFSDGEFWRAWANTLQYAGLTTVMAVIGGASVAILVSRTNLVFRRVFGRLILLPIVLPPLGLVLGWIVVWGPGGYLTNLFSQRLHLGTLAIDTIPGMSLIEASRLLPVAYMTCEAALSRADSSLEDAARSAGAGPARVLRSITIPMLRPALLNSSNLMLRAVPSNSGIPSEAMARVKISVAELSSAGRSIGIVIERSTRAGPAPALRAASSSEESARARAASHVM